MGQYKCKNCNAGFRLARRPAFCPFCGSNKIGLDHGKARETGLALIAECNAIAVSLEELWAQYIKLLAEYENKMQTLRVYKKRGIIKEEELPRYNKPTLKNELAALRAKLKEEKKTVQG